MKHSCKALILHCIDFRFGKAIRDYAEKNRLLNDYDVVAVAGAAKNLVSPTKPSDKEFVLRQIEISKKLHGIDEIILMNHTDCGAYGGRGAFHSESEEFECHARDLQEGRAVILAHFPGLEVKTVLVKINHAGAVDFQQHSSNLSRRMF